MDDLVYVVRPGEHNEELRYSLRSVETNLPPCKVWIVGTVPSWVRNVGKIPIKPHPKKFPNQRQSLAAACADPDISDRFVLMNDDHFILEPLGERLPVFHDGPMRAYIEHLSDKGMTRKNTWFQAICDTWSWLRIEDALCYENHTPLTFDKQRLGDLIARYPQDRLFAAASSYPSTGVGGMGRKSGNAKCKTDDSFEAKLALDMPYLSTNDDSFEHGKVGEYLRGMFPHPSRFEEA